MTGTKKRSASGLADPHLLDKIDKLFACNVGEYVALPQLVVVGDQSSGKSSVLEGLTDLPFPRDSGLCTRFATQISFRRSPTKMINVSVIPGSSSTKEHTEALQKVSQTTVDHIDAQSFVKIMKNVQVAMGVSTTDGTLPVRTFTDDVLRLEICGPEEEHLTVIDVPGIFRALTKGVTTVQDRTMVKSMVEGYMSNPRSLMLAVVPAGDIATQEILDLANTFDPRGSRTLGIFTKPDLVDKGSAQNMIDIIHGKKHQLALGWHVVRNPGQGDIDNPDPAKDRHAKENEFFNTEKPWNVVEKNKAGVATLRARLQNVLAGHIRREFPKVKLEISKRLLECKKELAGLGPQRETTSDQSKYLLEMSMDFQHLADLATDARYGGVEIFEQSPELRLATLVVSRNEQFADLVANCGQTFQFDKAEETTEIPLPAESNTTNKEIIGHRKSQQEVRKFEDVVDITDMTLSQTTVEEPDHGILPWLKQVFKTSRGFELGTFDASLLAVTMRKQSVKWDAIAKGYIADVATLVHKFIRGLLEHVCNDDRVRESMMSLLNDRLMDAYQKAFDQVQFILEVERGGTPVTLNHYFNDNLEKARQKRVQTTANKAAFNLVGSRPVVALDDIVKCHPMSNADHVVRDVHDILQSYYKVARKRFVDNVCMQAAAHHLVTGPDTPLKLLSPRFVASMTEDQLEDVAGEERMQKSRRASLKKEIADLEMGRKILV